MKFILLSLLVVTGAQTFAVPPAPPVVANLKIHNEEDGRKIFYASFDPKSQIGLVTAVFDWSSSSPEVQEGFELGAAQILDFRHPDLPDDCRLVTLEGTLLNSAANKSLFELVVVGDCAAYIQALATTPLEIGFMRLPHQTNKERVPLLVLKVGDLPDAGNVH